MSAEVYKSKAEWLERVMSSDLTPATKVFAWAVFNRMYGDKIASHPGKNTIQKDTGLNPSKYKGYRDALVGCGALDAVAEQSPTGEWENYRYALNLDWEGGTQRGTRCTPEGYRVVPTGVQGGTQRDTGVYPTGSSNTSIQDFNESSKGDFKEDASLAVAPEAATSEVQGLKDDHTSESLIPEPSLPTVPVDDSTSHESSISEASTNEADISPARPAEPARPARKTSTFSKGELQMAFSLLGASQSGAFGYPPNFDKFEKRIRQGGFEHLDTAQGQLLAAYEVIVKEREAA